MWMASRTFLGQVLRLLFKNLDIIPVYLVGSVTPCHMSMPRKKKTLFYGTDQPRFSILGDFFFFFSLLYCVKLAIFGQSFG